MVNRKLIDYLPQYVQGFVEMKEIMNTEQPEIDALWNATEAVFNDQFILDSTENGTSRWESVLGISPKDTDTLDERQFRILTRLNQELPYTMNRLKEVLTTLCGANGYSIVLVPDEYKLTIKLALSNVNNYGDVVEFVNKAIPANMISYIQIMYNANNFLSGYTHAELSAYTHKQLREDVIN